MNLIRSRVTCFCVIGSEATLWERSGLLRPTQTILTTVFPCNAYVSRNCFVTCH